MGDRIELPFVARQELAGWNGVIHGGLVATVLDEVMTWAAIVDSRSPCFAAELSVRLQQPLPPLTRCIAVATLVANRRRVLDTRAWLEDENGLVYARATGRYVPVPPGRRSDLRHDFVIPEDGYDIVDALGA